VLLNGMRVPVAVWQVRLRTAISVYFTILYTTKGEPGLQKLPSGHVPGACVFPQTVTYRTDSGVARQSREN